MDRLAAMSAFVRVVDTGSFSAAARQLRLGQPAVSRIVAALERDLDVRLLSRTTRRLQPTEAGLSYYEHARRALDAADEAEQAARGAGAGLSGRLRVSAAVTFTRLEIVPHLAEFMGRHPALEIELILDDRNVDLVGEGVDMALRMGRLADSAAVARRLATGRRVVVASPAFAARHGPFTHPEDLRRAPAIILALSGSGQELHFRRGDEPATVVLEGRIRTTAPEAAREAVLADMGYAVGSIWAVRPELASGAMVELLPDWSLPSMDLWALFPTGRRPSAKARAFADFVETLMVRSAA